MLLATINKQKRLEMHLSLVNVADTQLFWHSADRSTRICSLTQSVSLPPFSLA